MTKTGFTTDFKDFDKETRRIVEEAMPGLARKGLFDAAAALKDDADEEPPRTPHLHGDLRAEFEINELPGKLAVELVYEMPYAARWHEAEPGTIIWSEPGVGPKYVETKMARHNKKYMGVVAESIRTKSK